MQTTPAALVAASCLPAAPAQASDYVVVGPSAAYTSVQQALDDTPGSTVVLVESGTYNAGFTVKKDGRVVLGAPADGAGLPVFEGTVRVESADRVVLRDFHVRAPAIAITNGLVVRESFLLHVEGVTVRECVQYAGDVADSSASFVDCELIGLSSDVPWHGAGQGLRALNSALTLHATTVRGGHGENGGIFNPSSGRHGATLEGGAFFAVDSTFSGGNGGKGYSEIFSCVGGKPGGHGLVLTSAPFQQQFAYNCVFSGGSGGAGAGASSGSCAPGADGLPVDDPAASLLEFTGPMPTLTTIGAPSGDDISATLLGEPGHLSLVLGGATPELFWYGDTLGYLMLDFNPLLQSWNWIPGSGEVPLFFPDLWVGCTELLVLQGVTVDPMLGIARSTNRSVLFRTCL
ncbi:MAG: hypothetical protein AAF682_11610 [Planctomycetota bacterium]